IEMYESQEILWNVKCTDYRDRVKKHKTLEEIGVKFSCSGAEVQRKLHNLRNQLRIGRSVFPRLSSSRHTPGGEFFKFRHRHTKGWRIFETSEKPFENDATTLNVVRRKTTSKSSKRKREEEDDIAIKTALAVLAKGTPDECDKFGEYVALELRTLRNEYVRRKLKTEIRNAIVRAADEDEEAMCSFSSVCASKSTSSGYNDFLSSPPALPQTSESNSARDFINTFNLADL
ncbi:uncharacterized protein, partial [Anabrus simplex]|uniref:uncharacterized protein n=1 Tax=Anabrus simplex TaxID=316456 RepID=UPI0035A2BAE8